MCRVVSSVAYGILGVWRVCNITMVSKSQHHTAENKGLAMLYYITILDVNWQSEPGSASIRDIAYQYDIDTILISY